jgi:hypothetical protein
LPPAIDIKYIINALSAAAAGCCMFALLAQLGTQNPTLRRPVTRRELVGGYLFNLSKQSERRCAVI